MAWFATNIIIAFLLESIGFSNFGFVIRVLSFMIVPFMVGLDQVCFGGHLFYFGGHLFYFGCLMLFVICIFNDYVSDKISQGQLLLFVF